MLGITLRHLEVFVAIASTGTVKAAAEQVFISQPAASMALAELERQLDVPLFDRIRGRMQLSAKGRELLPSAQEVLARMQELQLRAHEQSPTVQGELALGTSNTVGNYLIGDLLGEFIQHYPQIKLNLQVTNTQNILKQMLEHRLDVACVEGPVQHPDLLNQVWRNDSLVVVTNSQHPLAQRTTLRAADFAQAQWILRESGSASRALAELALAELPAGQVVLELEHVEAIKQAVLAGVGIAFLPEAAIVDARQTGRLIALHTPFLNLERKIWLTVHKQRYQRAVLQAFLASVGWQAQR
ncbi:MAG TPA: LysR family transcriptional regulator [Candidatus Paenalcaligenes intestinipullorum]|uniref:LysR family transcriptional regulator n=1 Tax=Candidatus Paenalcaligenes intestinipullorum TaxID=2838718 RepID=A0A9D2U8B1_9BURK|nr:LysR family transcriptional regulator [Candidatus Paenalcaligenes intestinipullorum]